MFNIRFGVAYLRHQLKAINRHGLHSPFVYRLVDKVIYDYSAKKVYQQIEAALKRLPNDSKPPLPAKVLKLIYRIVADRQPKVIIQAGNELSLALKILQNVMPDAVFYTAGDDNAVGDKLLKADVVYLSGPPPKQTILNQFELCLPKVHDETLMIFENIHQNEAVEQAWAEIKADTRVSITVDLFWIGLVYFRKGKVKEDFFIKF